MNTNDKQRDKEMWNRLGKFLAVVITLIYIISITNAIWGYVPSGSVWETIVNKIIYVGPLALILITTFEAVADKSLLTRVLFLLFWVVIILFAISPTLWGLIKV